MEDRKCFYRGRFSYCQVCVNNTKEPFIYSNGEEDFCLSVEPMSIYAINKDREKNNKN